MGEFDPQFGTAHVLRPYAGFETRYEGQSANIPIMFTENGQPLDELAGQPGIDPELINGLAVTPGGRLIIYLPNIVGTVTLEPFVGVAYNWEISWRWRNISDYQRTRGGYHLAKPSVGLPSIASQRIIIPAANHSVVYNQAEPAGLSDRVAQNLRIEDISSRGQAQTLLPINPSGSQGKYQQGIFNPTTSGEPLSSCPTYDAYDVMAMGDEMMIGVYRSITPVATWLFTGGLIHTDALFAQMFGKDTAQGGPFDIGIYVALGVVP